MGEVTINFTLGSTIINKDNYCGVNYVNAHVKSISSDNKLINMVSNNEDMTQFIMEVRYKYTIYTPLDLNIGQSPSYYDTYGENGFYYCDDIYCDNPNYKRSEANCPLQLAWVFYSVNLMQPATVISKKNWSPNLNDDPRLAIVNLDSYPINEDSLHRGINSNNEVKFMRNEEFPGQEYQMVIVPTQGNNVFATRINGTIWVNESINESNANAYTYGLKSLSFSVNIIAEKIN